MFREGLGIKKAYIACGYTDLRYGIDGLASLIQNQFDLDPFDEGTLATVLQKGIVIQGHGIRLNKVTITSPSGITLTEADKAAVNAPAYTLGGQRVSQPLPGHLYIQNGKKFIAR